MPFSLKLKVDHACRIFHKKVQVLLNATYSLINWGLGRAYERRSMESHVVNYGLVVESDKGLDDV